MRSRRTAIITVTVLGLLGAGPVAAADGASGPGAPGVPETVSATIDGFESAATVRAAGADAGDAADGGAVSAPTEAPIPFSMVGLELPSDADVRLRTSTDGARWTEWHDMEPMESDQGPDAGSAEARAATSVTHSEPLWVGEARYVQVATDDPADLADIGATLIDSNGVGDHGRTVAAAAAPEPAYTAAAQPRIVSRSQWGADESWRRGNPSVASGGVRFAVVHHTAGSNSYGPGDGAGIVRGIYRYHTQSLGWDDIGYNLLVDRYGTLYEGRAGGLDRAVIGAHAQGFNTGSVGVSVIGTFTGASPPIEAQRAAADFLAWKFDHHRIDPHARITVRSGGSNKHPSGAQVGLHTIIGHRDVGHTACPGDAFYPRLGDLRSMVKTRMTGAAAPAPPPPTKGPGGFYDTHGSTHAASIATLASKGMVSGCREGWFCPLAAVSRAEVATMMVRAKPSVATAAAAHTFSDVGGGHTHGSTIARAAAAGWISGYTDGSFRPDQPISREQLASVLGRAAGLTKVQGNLFNDVAWTSKHLAYVNALKQTGISTGCGGGNYCPTSPVTREQLASFIDRALVP